MTTPTPEQLDTIRHSLGLNYQKRPYRNHFCTANGDPRLEEMVSLGLMRPGSTLNDNRDRFYLVTEAGAQAVGHTLKGLEQ